jgi:hypothetical protein
MTLVLQAAFPAPRGADRAVRASPARRHAIDQDSIEIMP